MPGAKVPGPHGTKPAPRTSSQKQLIGGSSSTSTSKPVAAVLPAKANLILFHADDVARFFRMVSFAQALSNNVQILHKHWWEGGDQIQESDMSTIRKQAGDIRDNLMTLFSGLCKTGDVGRVNGFLANRKKVFQSSMQQVNSAFNTVQQSNQNLQNSLNKASDYAHLVHGTAQAEGAVLGVLIPGNGVTFALGVVDTALQAQVTGQSTSDGINRQVQEKVAGDVADEETKAALGTFQSITTRDWQYAGALTNAQIRFGAQATIGAVATGASVYMAYQDTKAGVNEAGGALADILSGSQPTFVPITLMPDLAVPTVSAQ